MGDVFTDTAFLINTNRSSKRIIIDGQNKITYLKSIEYSLSDTVEGAAVRIISQKKPEVRLRFEYLDSTFSDWYECNGVPEPFSKRWYFGITVPGTETTKSVEFELTVNKEQDITIENMGLFLIIPESVPTKVDKSKSPRVYFQVTKPRIITRTEWEANPPQFGYSNMPYYNKLTLHHSVGFSADNLEEGIIQMQAIQLFHQEVRGWSDIGYHFVIDKAGNIYQGRPETVIGAHTSGANTGNIGTCVLGCYHPPASENYYCYDELSTSSGDSLIKLMAWISESYSIDPNVLLGHRDYYDYEYTTCPGDNLWSLLPGLRTEISSYRDYGPTPMSYRLYQNFPNPFNDLTEIKFDVSKQEKLELTIYNILGEKIISLANRTFNPGQGYSVYWDGKNSNGERVSSGVYLYSIQSRTFKKAIRMVYLK
jgi:hypothetical protein